MPIVQIILKLNFEKWPALFPVMITFPSIWEAELLFKEQPLQSLWFSITIILKEFLVCSLGKGPKKSVKENWSLRNFLVLHSYVSILSCCKYILHCRSNFFLVLARFPNVSIFSQSHSLTHSLTQSHTNGNFCISNQQGPKWTKKECLYFIWIRNAETPFRICYPLSYINFSEDSTDFVEQGVLFTDTVYW